MRPLILVVLLIFTAAAVHSVKESTPVPKSQSIVSALDHLEGGWENVQDTPMGQKVVDALELDDYIFRVFRKGNNTLTLYVGYYLTSKKVGAAHDPMVCFPGQGWILTTQKEPEQFPAVDGVTIPYSTMIAEKEGKKELVVYWFQAFDQPYPTTFPQKVGLLKQRLVGGGEDNAFVRITISLEGQSVEVAQQVVNDFVHSFYPGFLRYVRGATLP